MRRWLALLLVLFACNGESPTAPRLDSVVAQQVNFGCGVVGAYAEPAVVALKPGETREVMVRLCHPPAALDWTINTGPPEIASGSARIAAGQREALLRIQAHANGAAGVDYTVPNFGRAPSTQQIAIVQVSGGTKRRSAGRP